jgi:hypothetical protein
LTRLVFICFYARGGGRALSHVGFLTVPRLPFFFVHSSRKRAACSLGKVKAVDVTKGLEQAKMALDSAD